MDHSSFSGSDDEYGKLILSMNPPSIVIYNVTSKDETLIEVEYTRGHETTLQVVQALTDLNLIITKAYISSDSMWFLDVFNVTDQSGKKISDGGMIEKILDYIRKSLGAASCFVPSRRRIVGVVPPTDNTSIELTGADRPGLLSEVTAVLDDLHCNVVNAEIWTHNGRVAAILQVTDPTTGSAITNQEKLSRIKEILRMVIKSSYKDQGSRVAISLGVMPMDRRLHQMMFADGDYKMPSNQDPSNENLRSSINIANFCNKDYTEVTIRCKGRPKLLFDVVCTLTDMMYMIFHGNFRREGDEAYLELYIRHIDGHPVCSEAERIRLTQCLEAAIQRRVSEGLKLELCTSDRVGLLTDITRIFRENSLTVTRAEISTRDGKAINNFYARDATGNQVDAKIIHSIQQAVGQTILQVATHCETRVHPPQVHPPRVHPPQVHPRPFVRTISWNSVVNCVHSPPSL